MSLDDRNKAHAKRGWFTAQPVPQAPRKAPGYREALAAGKVPGKGNWRPGEREKAAEKRIAGSKYGLVG